MIGIPYLDLAALVAIALGVVTGLVLVATAIVRGTGTRAVPVTPVDYRRERLVPNPSPGTFAPDIAWPAYFSRQVRRDLSRVMREAVHLYRRSWAWPLALLVRGRAGPWLFWWILLPVPVLSFSFLVLGLGPTMALASLLYLMIVLAVGLVAATAYWAAVALLRIVDELVVRIRRADASCPSSSCYHVTRRPAYRCPGCSSLHRDIRPGVLGLFTRRCACGALLPTMVVRAAWRLTAVCQRCESPLRQGAAAVRDVRVPIFGDVSAGKTRFLYAALDSLSAAPVRSLLEVSFPDDESKQRAEVALELIRSGRDLPKTAADLPRAFSIRFGRGSGSTLLHLFDAAGERFRHAGSHDDMSFLGSGHGLVYVVDPFALGAVRDRLTGHRAAALRLAHAANADPESTYGEVVNRLRAGGVSPDAQRLAVVISKADLLRDCGIAHPCDDAGLAEWLTQAGLHNLVLAARLEFAEVRYFAVSSVAHGDATPDTDAGRPLRWLLRTRGVKMPDDPEIRSAVKVSP